MPEIPLGSGPQLDEDVDLLAVTHIRSDIWHDASVQRLMESAFSDYGYAVGDYEDNLYTTHWKYSV
jgi:hypothetical protein